MKKSVALLLILSFIYICVCACTKLNTAKKSNMVQAKRRFAQYMEPQQQKNTNTIDLSEGPKQNYNAKFGPKALDFDIKIVDPY